ncbi:MAG: CDP-archaeol synthase [Nitrospirae bacterium]|nr:CDP-archaeol synthase [Nitrospirota bacterium]
MLELILSSVYLIFPAYVANMCPVIFGKLNFPFGHSINKCLFGANKTYRGFYTAYIGALAILFLQQYLAKNNILTDYALLDYKQISIPLYAALFGFGAISGDLTKSFFKRRLHIKPGRPWFPFDQLDFVIGAYLFLLPAYVVPWQNLLTILILTPALHFLTNLIAYMLKLKKVWW